MLPAHRLPSRRHLRLASGLVLLAYMVVHFANHALGLVSLDVAERGLRLSVAVWHSPPGSTLLFGAALTHVALAFVALYDKPSHRLPAIEIVRIVAGFSIPVLLLGHLVSTRVAFEVHGAAATYQRVVGTIWAGQGEARQLALLAPGWLHGCLGIYIAFRHRRWYVRLRVLLVAVALGLPVLAGMGFLEMTHAVAALGVPLERLPLQDAADNARNALFLLYAAGFTAVVLARAARLRRTAGARPGSGPSGS